MQLVKLVLVVVISSCGIGVVRSGEEPELNSIEERLQEIQISINQMFMEASEQMEALSTEIRAFKQSLNSLVWYSEQVKRSIDVIETGNALLLRNVTLLTSQSDEIVSNQQYCANHEALKNLFFELKPKCGGINPVPTPPTPPTPPETVYTSCSYVPAGQSGVYRLGLPGTSKHFVAHCEMSEHGGRWLVFQRRQDGSVEFNRSLVEYRDGFGDPYGEYWLGLENLHQLTTQNGYELLITIEDGNGTQAYEKYSGIRIDSEQNDYKIYLNSSGVGNAGESFYVFRGEKFVTREMNGGYSDCARKLSSGYWHYSCSTTENRSNLNGVYNATAGDLQGIWWQTFKSGVGTPLKRVRMMIREAIN